MSASELNPTLDLHHASAAATPLDEQHPIGKSIFLHLIPGVCTLAFYIAVAPLVERLGFPPTFAGPLAILFILLPLEIGYLLYRGRRRNGRLSLAGVVRYREPRPHWQYALFVPVLVFWYFTASSLWRPVERTLAGAFSWVPSWATDLLPLGDPTTRHPAAAVLTVVVFQVVCSGVITPVVEELYFRGYLLPRIERLGLWAPVIGTVLFAFQHVWTPLQDPGRAIAWFPAVYLAWRKRNIYLGIGVHLFLNLVGVIFPIISIYGGG
jgi:membrane protease YdiL (CAAX protease family)